MIPREFKTIDLDGEYTVALGKLRPEHQLRPAQFEKLGAIHPATFHEVKIFGKLTPVPRFDAVTRVEPHLYRSRFNGLLVNWYDGALSHRIGPHRDDERELVVGTPILTISFGENRIFRLRKYTGDDGSDIELPDGSVLLIPYDTKKAYIYEVPAHKAKKGRRISVTIRAFNV